MHIEQLIAENTAAVLASKAATEENTAVLHQILAAGGAPSNVTPITLAVEKPAAAPAKAGKATKATPAAAPEPAEEKPTKVAVTAEPEDEFSDPLDRDTKIVVKGDPAPPKIDVEAVAAEIVDTFKGKMTEAKGGGDEDRVTELKDALAELRTEFGLAKDQKLITLAPTPQKLVDLLERVKAL